MKLFKKVISAVCALGMFAAMTSAFAAQTAVTPTLEITLQDYDETEKTGTLVIDLVNVDQTVEEGDNLYLGSLDLWVSMPATMFDKSYYEGDNVYTNVWTDNTKLSSSMNGPNYLVNPDNPDQGEVITMAWASANKRQMISANNRDDMSRINLLNIVFHKVTDEPIDTKDLIVDKHFKVTERIYEDSSPSNNNFTASFTFGNMTDADANALYAGDKIPGIEIVGPIIPAATGATATGDQLLNLKPSDIGLEGDEWTTEDPAYADEKAVVSLANVKKDDAITGFTWEIKATDAEGNPLEKTTEYFKAGNIESAAEVTVGLVVGYDTTEWQSVEIVGVTAE